MNPRHAVGMLKAARKAWASDSRLETYIAVAFAVVALAILYRQYSAVRKAFKAVR